MSYDNVVFIGFVIDTAPKLNPDGTQTYLGLADPAEDIAARCQLMRDAMTKAKTMLPPPVGNPLYVFVAPEFYLRGKTGAYDLTDVNLAVALLQEIAADPAWNDWVFTFGTIIGQWEDQQKSPPIQICNFALTQQGGVSTAGPDSARVVVKELKSNIDFIAAGANPGGLLWGAVNHPEAGPPALGGERQRANYDGAGIFGLAGLTWAVEICLDHLAHRLTRSPQLPGSDLVQVQLVPSCGADIDVASMITELDGFSFNVDGHRNTAHATLFQQAWLAQEIFPSARAPVGVTDVTISASPPTVVQVSDLYASGSGAIWLYPSVMIPPALKVTGQTVEYTWQASSAPFWRFSFFLIYDISNKFVCALIEIHNSEIRFDRRKYYFPLNLYLTFPKKDDELVARTGQISLSMKASTGPYCHLIYGDIDVPGFRFQGGIMEFTDEKDSPLYPTKTIWPDVVDSPPRKRRRPNEPEGVNE